MKFLEIKLPSNQKFGFFFAIVISIMGLYFFYKENIIISYTSFITSLLFLLTAIFKSNLLLPLNKAWMRLGFILGAIVNPIVLGSIFFLLFTPLAIIMRLFGRDELHLKLNNKCSNWKKRYIKDKEMNKFKQQF